MAPRDEATGVRLPYDGEQFKGQSIAERGLGAMRELLARSVLVISKGDRCPETERRRLLRAIRRVLGGSVMENHLRAGAAARRMVAPHYEECRLLLSAAESPPSTWSTADLERATTLLAWEEYMWRQYALKDEAGNVLQERPW